MSRVANVASRAVETIIHSIKVKEGAGFTVARPFPSGRVQQVDPFLMIDHMGPITYKPYEAVGAPWHPHRGFETVSYLLAGEMQHQDSMGNSGQLRAGDLQWMTAGSGIVHDEEPSDAMKEKGGTMEGFQIWVNLPAKDKMCDPFYQDVPKEKIPIVYPLATDSGNGPVSVRVVAGEAYGQKGVVATRWPILYLDFHCEKGAKFTYDVPSNYNAMAFIYRGSALCGLDKQVANEDDCVVFKNDGDATRTHFEVTADQGARFLLLGGVPINEPIARHGPFVMNTKEEIRQALVEWNLATFVKVKAQMGSKTEHQTPYDPKRPDASVV